MLEHPSGDIQSAAAATLTGGPALYLLGNMLFKRSVGTPWLFSHLIGMALFAVLFVVAVLADAAFFDALVLTWIANAILLARVLAEERTFRSMERADE